MSIKKKKESPFFSLAHFSLHHRREWVSGGLQSRLPRKDIFINHFLFKGAVVGRVFWIKFRLFEYITLVSCVWCMSVCLCVVLWNKKVRFFHLYIDRSECTIIGYQYGFIEQHSNLFSHVFKMNSITVFLFVFGSVGRVPK